MGNPANEQHLEIAGLLFEKVKGQPYEMVHTKEKELMEHILGEVNDSSTSFKDACQQLFGYVDYWKQIFVHTQTLDQGQNNSYPKDSYWKQASLSKEIGSEASLLKICDVIKGVRALHEWRNA